MAQRAIIGPVQLYIVTEWPVLRNNDVNPYYKLSNRNSYE